MNGRPEAPAPERNRVLDWVATQFEEAREEAFLAGCRFIIAAHFETTPASAIEKRLKFFKAGTAAADYAKGKR